MSDFFLGTDGVEVLVPLRNQDDTPVHGMQYTPPTVLPVVHFLLVQVNSTVYVGMIQYIYYTVLSYTTIRVVVR